MSDGAVDKKETGAALDRPPVRYRAEVASRLLKAINAAAAREGNGFEGAFFKGIAGQIDSLNGAELAVKLNTPQMSALLHEELPAFYAEMRNDGGVNCNTDGGTVYELRIPSGIKELAAQAAASQQKAL